jgi:hypothetical protein
MELDPSYPDVREDYAELLIGVGHAEESARAARQLVTLDPYFGVGWIRVYNAAVVLDRRAEVEESAEQLSKILGGAKTGSAAYTATSSMVEYELMYRRLDRMRATLADMERRDPESGREYRTLMTWALAEPGADEKAAKAIIESLEAPSWVAAPYYAARRDIEGYNAEFARAAPIQQARYFLGLYQSNPDGRAMLRDARVKPLLEKYGFVAYWREKGWPGGCRALGDTDFECGL